MECGVSSSFHTHSIKRRSGVFIILHQSRFALEYVKHHVQSIQKVSEADHCVVQNLTWSVVYLRNTLSNTLLQKLLTLIPLTATVPEVFVSTMTIFLSDSYDALEENLTHMKSLELKSYPGEKVIDWCAAIFVDAEHLEIIGAFNPEHLGYITRIFEDTPESILRLWGIQKYASDVL